MEISYGTEIMKMDKQKIRLSFVTTMIKINSERDRYEKIIDVWKSSSTKIYGDNITDAHWNMLKILLCTEFNLSNSEGDVLVTSLAEKHLSGEDIKSAHNYDCRVDITGKKVKKCNVFPFRKS